MKTMKVRAAVVGLAGCLALAGCNTTVAGRASVDPSGIPKPQTGSFSTEARTIGATTQADGETLEGFRMAETVPYLYEIDSALHFQGRVRAGQRSSIVTSVKYIFGENVSAAFGKAEAGVTVGASDKQQGSKYDANTKERSVSVGVFRFPSPADAAAVVGQSLLVADKPATSSSDPLTKTPTTIPGYANAVAYTRTDKYSGTWTVAFVPYKQYVLAVTGSFSPDQIRTYFDKQGKALDGFTPTPLDKVTTLGLDPQGVAKLTLAPDGGTGGYALPARSAVLRQTDVARSVKTFADAGVDQVGAGNSTVYRAKDEKGAKHIYDEFVAENRGAFTNIDTQQVTGAPGATCLTFPTYEGSSSKMTWCVVAVGRYLAEFSDTQSAKAVQGIGAQYLILAAQK